MNKISTFTLALLLTVNSLGNLLAQVPNMGSTTNFVLFTSVGAVTNTGISQITGNVGSNIGAGTGFGNVNGVMHSGNGTTAQCTADLIIAYDQLNAAIPDFFIAPLLGNGDTLVPGVYSIAGVTTLDGDLILNGQRDTNAVFIFQIQAAFSTTSGSKVKLINGALACNVFWKVEGLVEMASGTFMRGSIVAHNAGINMGALDTLEGRALSTTGAIAINGVVAFTPAGCGSIILTGPMMPTLGSAAEFTLFTSNGAMTNAGISNVIGDVGTNVGLTTGFDPLLVIGIIHPIPDISTGAAAADLLNAANLMNIMPYDIELLYPAQFGNDLVLTPHTYILNAATSLTGNVFLNAEGNPDAVFFFKIYGALSTSTASNVILMNGAQASNVYWLVSGAVSISSNSIFNGTIISINGAISTFTGVQLTGRLLTTDGAFSTAAITATAPSLVLPLSINWLYFNSQVVQKAVLLTWSIKEQLNIKHFLLEKSSDGIFFEKLSTIDLDTIDNKKDYEFVDHQPFYTNYYRISTIDKSGQTSIYKTIKVITTQNASIQVTHQVIGSYIDLKVVNAPIGKGTINLYTAEGSLVSSSAINLNIGFNQYQINKPYTKGMYLVKIIIMGKTLYSNKILVN